MLALGHCCAKHLEVIRASEQGIRTVKMMPAGCRSVRQETYCSPSSPWAISSSDYFEALHLPSVAPVRLGHICPLRGALQLTLSVEAPLHFSILHHTGNRCKCVKTNQERTQTPASHSPRALFTTFPGKWGVPYSLASPSQELYILLPPICKQRLEKV